MTALSSTLLEMTVMASVMIGIVLTIRAWLSPKMNPAVMIALWALVLLRLCLPLTIASPLRLADLMPRQAVAQAIPQPTTAPVDLTATPVKLPAAPVKQPIAGTQDLPATDLQGTVAASHPSILAVAKDFLSSIPLWSALAVLWAAGALAVLQHYARKMRLFHRKLRICKPIADVEILRIIRHYEKCLAIKRNTPALECNFVDVPMVFGCFKPVILLPAQFVRHMDKCRLGSILLHELCHVKRHDTVLNTIWLLAKAVHWFNPLVWAAYRVFQSDLELSRDQMVVRRLDGSSRLDYGQSLIDSARYAKEARNPLSSVAASLFVSKSRVKERIHRLVEPQKRSSASLLVSAVLTLLMLVSCFTTACQPTPTGEYVKNKKDDSFLNQLITAGNTGNGGASGTASGSAVAPENNIFKDYAKNWKATIQVKPHPISVNIDADVVTPVAASLPIYTVKPNKLTQEQIDGFLSQFGNVQYHLDMEIKTKSYYQEQILQLQATLAKLPENKEYTEEQRKQQQKDLENGIQFMQKEMQSAPGGTDDVIEPKFTNKYIIMRDSAPEQAVDNNGNLETAPPGAQTAKEHYERTHTDAIAVKWSFQGASMSLYATRCDDLGFNDFSFASIRGSTSLPSNLSPAEALAYASGASTNIIPNTTDIKGLKTTCTQAKALAEDAVAKLGIDYMSVALSAKEIKYDDIRNALNHKDTSYFTDFSKLEYTNVDYVFYFTRSLGGVNETYCSNGIQYRTQYDEPWPYERLSVIVDDSGVRQIDWDSCGSKLGKQISSDSKLLPFDQIKKIAEQQFTDGNINISSDESSAAYLYKHLVKMHVNIDRVTLGYARIKLNDNSGNSVLVPVWDFFGNDAFYEKADDGTANDTIIDYSLEHDGVASYGKSYLTINAIDGSVIDRSKGY